MTGPEYLLVEQTPFDVDRISQILREADLICTPVGIDDQGFDPYELADYRVQERVHANKGLLLLDLNVLRRVNSLHPDGAVAVGPQERVAAALMAFSIYINAKLDPGLAVMEWFSPEQKPEILKQIHRFRELDNTDPTLFADIALGVTDALPVDGIRRLPKPTLPDMPERPTGWQFDYTALLKVAILTLKSEQGDRSRADVMEDFLNWCWGDYLFSSPAIQFGGLYLSPLRKKRMFKSLRSGDAEKALAGVRNATWDLSYLREWGRRTLEQRDSDHFNFFCSLDRALRESGREFLILGEGVPVDAQVALWERLWGEREAKRLFQVYIDLAERQDDPSRGWHSAPSKDDLAEELKRELEAELTQIVDSLP